MKPPKPNKYRGLEGMALLNKAADGKEIIDTDISYILTFGMPPMTAWHPRGSVHFDLISVKGMTLKR